MENSASFVNLQQRTDIEKTTMCVDSHLQLGTRSRYASAYDNTPLQPVDRQLHRQKLGISASALPFHGEDSWTLYELSWLNDQYLPQVAIGDLRVNAHTPNLIESKSLKLYLNSFNQTCFSNWHQVTERLQHDLSRCAGGSVQITLIPLVAVGSQPLAMLNGLCIDDENLITINPQEQAANQELLATVAQAPVVEEQLVSHLFKSNCPLTQQPDWASLHIHYAGPQIVHHSLLRYLISFRSHNGFHEQCVEQIFCDIQRHCKSERLSVLARYTRRGGIDINPFRSNWQAVPANQRVARQ